MAVTPDGQRAVSASADGTLKVWELSSGRELHTLTGHMMAVTAVAVTPDGQRAVSASNDGRLKIWELAGGRELRTLTGHARAVTVVVVTPNGQRLVSAAGETLRVWDLDSGGELRALTGNVNDAIALEHDAASLWWAEPLNVPEVLSFNAYEKSVRAVTVTPDGQRAVSASEDDTVNFWDLETGKVLATFTCDGAMNCCAFSNALKLIIAGDAGGQLHFLRLEEPKAKR